jgi:lipoprotein-anchoring transpeptidase ErfK/SrfK
MKPMRRALHAGVVIAGIAALLLPAPGIAGAAALASSGATAVSILPAHGDVVGVAQPVVVQFAAPVANRAAAEDAIAITSPSDAVGRFEWLNSQLVQWVPETLWPAHSRVKVTAGHLSTSFETAAAVLGIADISAHTFTVSIDGQVAHEMPASMGKPGFNTPVGTFSVLEKQRSVMFDSRTIGIPLNDPEGYLIKGEYAVRITWGGVYVHSAPWSVGSQGNTNVSHGCINLSPDNAAWYFDTVRTGDPVIVQS